MAYSNVASCVISIVGSFSNGIDVFKRLRDKRLRKKRSKKTDPVDEAEWRLSRSLRQGPEDIGREYQRSVYAAGQDFEIGDAIAQTSLAEIILRLNTGLVSIITSFLNNDKNSVQLDYQSLTNLSERSRIDTCRTLRQLFQRMAHIRRPLAITDNNRRPSHADRRPSNEVTRYVPRKKRSAQAINPARVRGPMLAQVIIEDSNKPPQIAMVRPGERRKKSTSSSGSSLSKAGSASSSALSTPLLTPPPQYTPLELPQRPAAQRTHTAPEPPRPRRKQSAANVKTHGKSSDLPIRTRATQSTPHLDSTLPPSMPPPLPTNNHVQTAQSTTNLHGLRRRKQTPTYYSTASTSNQTQIGEIPLHLWAEPYDFDAASVMNREAYAKGWPANQLADGQGTKRRFGFGRLFGRKKGGGLS